MARPTPEQIAEILSNEGRDLVQRPSAPSASMPPDAVTPDIEEIREKWIKKGKRRSSPRGSDGDSSASHTERTLLDETRRDSRGQTAESELEEEDLLESEEEDLLEPEEEDLVGLELGVAVGPGADQDGERTAILSGSVGKIIAEQG